MRKRPVVAIDGPAASGKSTTARAVAEALGFTHLDSGALYRAVTLVGLQKLEPSRWTAKALVAAARAARVALHVEGSRFELRIGGRPVGDIVRSDSVTREVSRVAAMGPVRDYVNGILRAAAAEGGVILDGRDIGTVVFPDAEVKVFLVANPEERARRRLADMGRKADAATVRGEAGALTARDEHDRSRAVAPLAQAPDAVLIDTSQLPFAEQVRRVLDLVRKAGGG